MTESLTYQEMLRTLGVMIEQAGCDRAVILLSAQGVEVIAPSWRRARVLDSDALRAESAAQRNRRRRQRTQDHVQGGALTRCLRVIGTEIDLRGVSGRYTIRVRPADVQVDGPGGYRRIFDPDTLHRRAVLSQHLRGQLAIPLSGRDRAPTEVVPVVAESPPTAPPPVPVGSVTPAAALASTPPAPAAALAVQASEVPDTEPAGARPAAKPPAATPSPRPILNLKRKRSVRLPPSIAPAGASP